MTKRVQARARVTVTLDVEVQDTWGPDCPIRQVDRQARESAVDLLNRAFRDFPNIRVVAAPAVAFVTTEVER